MARKEFLEYVYKTCIKPQEGYAFALNHTVPYSVIGVQEAHLATHYNPLYWACACLCCNAGNTVGDMDFDEDEPTEAENQEAEETEDEAEPTAKKKRAAPNYGKIAKAISDVQLAGVEVSLPNINESEGDFVPDVKHNRILYSLNTVSAVSEDIYQQVMAKRPFSSVDDFLARVEGVTVSQMIGMIKAGCFDELENKPRQQILSAYLRRTAEEEIPVKESATVTQLKKAIELGMDLSKYKTLVWAYNFKKWIDANQYDKEHKRYVLDDRDAINFFYEQVADRLNQTKDEYSPMPGGAVAAKKSAVEREIKKMIEPLMAYLNSPEGLLNFAETCRKARVDELREKYGQGTVAEWEMEQLSFYHQPHELAKANQKAYGISDFFQLPETPVTEEYIGRDGVRRQSPRITAIAGTVVDTDNLKHIVQLLTTTGVVGVKMYGDLYNRYKQRLTHVDDSGKKTLLDESWFKRGTKLIVYGFRREEGFVAKGAKVNGGMRQLCRIDSISPSGTLSLSFSRNKN